MMKKCDWCGRITVNTKEVESLGEIYNVCSKCFLENQENICINCGEPIGYEAGIKGMCSNCFDAQYEEKQRKKEEMVAGVDLETYEIYASCVEFTEEDYEKWVTFGQTKLSPEVMKKFRLIWLKHKLKNSPTWSEDLVKEKFDDIERVINGNLSKLTTGGLILVNIDGKAKGNRITEFVANSGTVYLVKKVRNLREGSK